MSLVPGRALSHGSKKREEVMPKLPPLHCETSVCTQVSHQSDPGGELFRCNFEVRLRGQASHWGQICMSNSLRSSRSSVTLVLFIGWSSLVLGILHPVPLGRSVI